MSSTRSARKRGAKAQPAAKATVIDQLLAVKRGLLVPASIEAAALADRRLSNRRLGQLEDDMRLVNRSIEQVQDIRARLLDVPARPQQGSVL